MTYYNNNSFKIFFGIETLNVKRKLREKFVKQEK
jgi:hypothetical protein